jgi:hypothetical protein
MDDARAAQLLGVRELPDGREREVGHDDLAAPPAKVERAQQRADRRRDRGHHRDLGGPGVDQLGEGAAHSLTALDPVLPRRSFSVPVGQVGVIGRADLERQRALRAAVDIGLALEDRET